jgi:hypothetical protein
MAMLPRLLGIGGIMGFLIAETGEIDEQTGELNYDVMELRDPEGLSLETRKVIDLITIQDNIRPIGSQKYKVQRYTTDIDLFEKYTSCCDFETATSSIAKKLQTIAKEIKSNTIVYFGKFKAGLDQRYDIDLGHSDPINHSLTGYDSNRVVEKLSSLLINKLLTEEEYVEMVYLANTKLNFGDYEKLNKMIKHKKEVHWKIDEIIEGKKTLPGGLVLTLAESITHKSPIKLTVWAQAENNRYLEFSNFFFFIYIDKDGNEHVLNLEAGDIIDKYVKDIIHYSSDGHRKSMKLAEIIWQLAVNVNSKEILEKLYPLFKSDIGLLNQVSSDIDLLIDMIETLPTPPYKEIISELEDFKTRLSSFQVPGVKFDEKIVYLLINSIIYLLIDSAVDSRQNYESPSSIDKGLLIKNLNYLKKYCGEIVEKYSYNYLIDHDIDYNELIEYAINQKNGIKKPRSSNKNKK